jgi:hypothetical protein
MLWMSRLWKIVGIVSLLLVNAGCVTSYHHIEHQRMPIPIAVQTMHKTVGVTMNSRSKAPRASSVAPTQVVELFVRRMREEAMFSDIIFPYTELAHVQPSILFDATVTIDEQAHWVENFIKAALTGASFFILTPVLPLHFGFVVDLDVERRELETGTAERFRYASQYECYYWIYPLQKVLVEWLERTQLHAVEDVLNQIKRTMNEE